MDRWIPMFTMGEIIAWLPDTWLDHRRYCGWSMSFPLKPYPKFNPWPYPHVNDGILHKQDLWVSYVFVLPYMLCQMSFYCITILCSNYWLCWYITTSEPLTTNSLYPAQKIVPNLDLGSQQHPPYTLCYRFIGPWRSVICIPCILIHAKHLLWSYSMPCCFAELLYHT